MATTLKTLTQNFDSDHYSLVVDVILNSQSTANNTSSITVKGYLRSNTQYHGAYCYTSSSTVNVNGSSSTDSPSWDVSANSSTQIFSKNYTIAHNSDGSKTINVSWSFDGKISPISSSVSGNVTLTKIPRYATSTQTLISRTETSITMQWSSDSTCDYIWYSKNNGSSWTAVGSVNAKSGTYTISGLAQGTTYQVKTRVRRKDSQLTTDSSSFSIGTYRFPYAPDTVDFVIGEPLTVRVYNPLARDAVITLIGADDSEFGETAVPAPSGLSSHVIFSGEDFADWLYSTTPNNASNTYRVKVVWNNHTETTTNGIYAVNPESNAPIFSDFAFADTNSTTTSITGNDQYFISGYSQMTLNIMSSSKAVAKNLASMSEYVISGLFNDSVGYSSDNVTKSLGTVAEGLTSASTLAVRAVDSRGLGTTVEKSVNILPYKAPTLNIKATRLNDFENDTTIKASGQMSLLEINNVSKNAIMTIDYRVAEKDDEYGNPISLTCTSDDTGKFTIPDFVLDLDNEKEWKVEIIVTDKLETTTEEVIVSRGVPIFRISTQDNNLYNNEKRVLTEDDLADLDIKPDKILNLVYPIGSIYMSVSEVSPQTFLGGTWERIKDKFLLSSGDTISADTTGGS
ncbi:MAG: DUF859 family phage minor structural protein, partial [Candidatus Saccharibacteria bacterium]|nr:DUF859 family phage minor structural protein [Candidatus Saccharibacteria bacterium]